MPQTEDQTEGKITDIHGTNHEVQGSEHTGEHSTESTIEEVRRTDALPEEAHQGARREEEGHEGVTRGA